MSDSDRDRTTYSQQRRIPAGTPELSLSLGLTPYPAPCQGATTGLIIPVVGTTG